MSESVLDQNGPNDHFGQNALIPNWILAFPRPKWTMLVHFGPFRSTVLWPFLKILADFQSISIVLSFFQSVSVSFNQRQSVLISFNLFDSVKGCKRDTLKGDREKLTGSQIKWCFQGGFRVFSGCFVARAIRNAIRANRFARIIRN